MKAGLLFGLLILATIAEAQIPEDAIRFSWQTTPATARIAGAGGVGGSIGGDLSAAYLNPAGIGFYHVNEAVVAPALSFGGTDFLYRGQPSTNTLSKFSLSPSGLIIAGKRNSAQKSSYAFAISVSQTADFKKQTNYRGLNNFSSYAEQFAEEFARSGLTIDQALNTLSAVPYTAAPALYTYLIDTVRVNNQLTVRAASENILLNGQALKQEFGRTESGGMYDINFAAAHNSGEKWLFGGSLGIPIVQYESDTRVIESDTSANTTNGFSSFDFRDNYTTKGAGVNAKLGAIYRPADYIRIGLAFHTPSFLMLTDSRQSNLSTTLENPALLSTVSSDLFTNNSRGRARYVQTTPWKALLSASYVFREVTDVVKQRGFISIDAEYQNHRGTRFNYAGEEVSEPDKAYFDQLNDVIKDIYKGAFNVRAGGELKFNTIMARLGFGLYGSPYKDQPSSVSRTSFSGGLGYRNKGFFIDLAFILSVIKDFDVPYRLQNVPTVFASSKRNLQQVVTTLGVKF